MKITQFLSFLNQLKVFHWQTKSYAQHIALGEAYETLDELFDKFVETYYGKYGRPEKEIEYGCKAFSYKSDNVINIIQEYKDVIMASLVVDLSSDSNNDLLNIKDEIEAEINKLVYLLTLN
jgi:DNA-binding ferritin-like protein